MLPFIKQTWPVLLFYIIGDILTTVWALSLGAVELNPFLAWAIGIGGYAALLVIKVAFLACLLLLYRDLKGSALWHVSRYSLGTFGLLLTVNNLRVGGAL